MAAMVHGVLEALRTSALDERDKVDRLVAMNRDDDGWPAIQRYGSSTPLGAGAKAGRRQQKSRFGGSRWPEV